MTQLKIRVAFFDSEDLPKLLQQSIRQIIPATLLGFNHGYDPRSAKHPGSTSCARHFRADPAISHIGLDDSLQGNEKGQKIA